MTKARHVAGDGLLFFVIRDILILNILDKNIPCFERNGLPGAVLDDADRVEAGDIRHGGS